MYRYSIIKMTVGIIPGGVYIFCIVAREYGYKRKEIAGYIQKDPAVVTSPRLFLISLPLSR